MNVNGKSRSNKLRVAYEESRTHVHKLPCGAFGTSHQLYNLAKMAGFNGTETAFYGRLMKAGGFKTLAQLAVLRDEKYVRLKAPVDKSDVIAAMKSLDARKAAIKDAAR